MALEPITRQEKIIAGQDLTPITRMEKFLKEFGGGGGGGAQPDWNAAEGEPGHILNRPFYESTEVLFDQRVEFELLEGLMGITAPFPEPLEPGKTYRVTYNDVAYDCVANIGPSGELCYLGNASIMGLDDTGEPFVVLVVEEMGQVFGQIASINSDTSATIRIEKTVIHPIDPKFLTGVLLYADESGYLYKSDVLSEENEVSMDEVLGYAKKGMTVVVTPYAIGERTDYYYATVIIKITTEEPNYARVLVGSDSYYHSKERVVNAAPAE